MPCGTVASAASFGGDDTSAHIDTLSHNHPIGTIICKQVNCTAICFYQGCGCSCEDCTCNHTSHNTNDANRTVYSNQGGFDPIQLIYGVNALTLHNGAGSSTTESIPRSETSTVQAAPTPTVFDDAAELVEEDEYEEWYHHEPVGGDIAYTDGGVMDRDPWSFFTEAEARHDVVVAGDDLDDIGSSMHVSHDFSEMERSMLLSYSSGFSCSSGN